MRRTPLLQHPGNALIIGLGLLAAQACAPSNTGSFHIYDSPLLTGKIEPRYPRSHSSLPAQTAHRGAPRSRASSADRADAGHLHEVASTEQIASSTASSSRPALATTRKDVDATAVPTPPDEPSLAAAANYIWSLYDLNGITFPPAARQSVPALFRACKDRGSISHSTAPAIGDIVFFHNTVDRNRDGRNNDWYTFAAVVEARGKEGKIQLLGYQHGKVQRLTMDLTNPNAQMDRRGDKANSQLRAPQDSDPPFAQHLAGQLFAGTCQALGERAQFVIVDNWQPGMTLK